MWDGRFVGAWTRAGAEYGRARDMPWTRRNTLRGPAVLRGRGVHSDVPVTLTLRPAEAESGVAFLRTGLPNGASRRVEARWSRVSSTDLCTVLGDAATGSVSTVEHLMAALSALGVDDVLAEVDGPEVPIMDGSAAAFVAAIDAVGLRALDAPRRHVEVLRTVKVERGGSWCELSPGKGGLGLDVEIDYASRAIGRSRKAMRLSPTGFRRSVSRARTFGMVGDVERLWAMGLALGSSLDNSVAVDGDRVLNPEGLRYPDEFVAHKMLDVIGDLALAGAPIHGRYAGSRPGHGMNLMMLQALFADRTAYRYVEAPVRPGPRRLIGTGAMSPALG